MRGAQYAEFYAAHLSNVQAGDAFSEAPGSYKEALENLDERWGDPAYWQAIRRNTSSLTPFYLLAAVDHRIDDLGEVAPATPDQAIYLDIFARTFWMGLVITAVCLLLAYPLAYLLAASAPPPAPESKPPSPPEPPSSPPNPPFPALEALP